MARRDQRSSFWSLVQIGTPDACWDFQGPLMRNGYGHLWFGGHKYLAHRLAYLLHHGVLDPSLFVLHSCDNRRCCNPSHLRQGTAKENTRDMLDRRRQRKQETYARGSKQWKAKLSEEKVVQILKEYKDKNYQELADRYGVSDSNIQFIVSGKTWKHVPRPEAA